MKTAVLKFFEPLNKWLFAYLARFGLVLQATDTLLTISMITNEALMVLENELQFTAHVTQEYNDQFALDGAKIGDTLNVRRPPRFTVSSGPNLSIQDFTETSVPVVIGDTASYGDQAHVDVAFTTKDMLLSLGDFSKRVVKPAVAAVANRVDYIGLQMAKNWTAQIVGTAGTPPTDALIYMNANAILTSQATPQNDRCIVIEPFTGAAITNALKGLLVPADKLGAQYRKGMMGSDSLGMDWYMDQNVNTQGFGYWASTASTLTANTTTFTGSITTGWARTATLTLTHGASLTLNQGDVIRIAGVYPVNPQNRQVVGTSLQPFVVQTTVSGSGSSTLSVTLSPAIITGGQFQNVSVVGATSTTATVTPFSIGTSGTGTQSPQNIQFHKNAFTCVMADLPLPSGVDRAARASSKKAGMSIRLVRQYTINNDQLPTRFDVLFGWAPLYPELAVRVAA